MTASTPEAWHGRPAVRFLFAGGTNTLITGLLVVLLSLVVPSWLAFTMAFALGIGYATVVNARWVFRSHLSARRAVAYALSYCLIYLVGLVAVHLIDALHGPAILRGATVMVTAPMSFLAGRFVFTHFEETAGSGA